jgi:hypothetical protein
MPPLRYPGEREFAFTIFDDTDDATLENVGPIYELLHELGMRTTKTVWPVDCPEGSAWYYEGATLADDAYRAFAHQLIERGFELTWHCATMESSTRERIERGLHVFCREFGFYPSIHANHGQNRENIYWGSRRYHNPLLRGLAKLGARGRDGAFAGEVEGSPYFWGDLCRRHFRYVRGFTFHEINTLRADPALVYRLRSTPYVNCWFSTSEAADAKEFTRLVTRQAIDRLRAEQGLCILSTHLGKGFVRSGRVDPRVDDALRYAASLPGWFVPVSEMLDWFVAQRPPAERSGRQQLAIEFRHAADRARVALW